MREVDNTATGEALSCGRPSRYVQELGSHGTSCRDDRGGSMRLGMACMQKSSSSHAQGYPSGRISRPVPSQSQSCVGRPRLGQKLRNTHFFIAYSPFQTCGRSLSLIYDTYFAVHNNTIKIGGSGVRRLRSQTAHVNLSLSAYHRGRLSRSGILHIDQHGLLKLGLSHQYGR